MTQNLLGQCCSEGSFPSVRVVCWLLSQLCPWCTADNKCLWLAGTAGGSGMLVSILPAGHADGKDG